MERCRLALRRLAHEAVQFRGRGLVDAATLLDAEDAHGFEQAQGTETVGVGRVLGLLERHGDMALRGEVVDFVRLDLLDHAHEAGRIGQVAIVQGQLRAGFIEFAIQMVDAFGVERGGAALEAMHLVALGQQQLGKVRPVLAGDAGDQSSFLFHRGIYVREGDSSIRRIGRRWRC